MMGLWQRGACRVASRLCTRRLCSSPPPAPPPRPTPRQLWRLALASGVPFVGFGIADNGIMIIAGDQIDATLGVRLGISTLAAAGLGNMLSDVCGVGLGESIEAFCIRAGLHAPALTREQCQLRVTRFTKIGACGFGVALGCLIGMAPLLFISNRKQVYFDDDSLALFEQVFAPHGVSAHQFFELLQYGRWKTAEAGSSLVHQREKLDRVLLIHSGTAQAWKTRNGGSQRQLEVLYAGRCQGEEGEAQVEEDRARYGMPVPVRNFIGGTALVDNVGDEPYPNEVVATRRVRYIEFPLHALREAMKDDKSVEAAVLSTLYREMVCRKRAQQMEEAQNAKNEWVSARHDYLVMLRALLVDDLVNDTEKEMLRAFAERNQISEDEHTCMLAQLNWSKQEFDDGVKKHRGGKPLRDFPTQAMPLGGIELRETPQRELRETPQR